MPPLLRYAIAAMIQAAEDVAAVLREQSGGERRC